jgi:hypothetical protein
LLRLVTEHARGPHIPTQWMLVARPALIAAMELISVMTNNPMLIC